MKNLRAPNNACALTIWVYNLFVIIENMSYSFGYKGSRRELHGGWGLWGEGGCGLSVSTTGLRIKNLEGEGL